MAVDNDGVVVFALAGLKRRVRVSAPIFPMLVVSIVTLTVLIYDWSFSTSLSFERPALALNQSHFEGVSTWTEEEEIGRRRKVAERRAKIREKRLERYKKSYEERMKEKLREEVLMDTENLKPFAPIDGMKSIPDDAEIKKELMSKDWFFREENIMYRSKFAVNFAKRAPPGRSIYPPRGIIWGAVGSSKVGGQGKSVTDGLDVFKRYMVEISKSAQSARMYLSDRSKKQTGLALVIDYGLEHLLPEQIELFDYIIYNRIPELAAEQYPDGIAWCGKVSILLFTPFDKTIYVDGDTRFCSDVNPEYAALLSASIALASEHRAPQNQQNNLLLNFNAGVIVYRKTRMVAMLMHDVIQTILLEWRGDQSVWAERLMETSRYGNFRVNVLSPRFHLQPCRATKENCVISGDVIILHGRCWLSDAAHLNLEDTKVKTAAFCSKLNAYDGSRFVVNSCGKFGVYKLSTNGVDASITNVEAEVTDEDGQK